MDNTYLLLKFLHVAAVIVWVGGMVALVVLNARLATVGEPAAMAALGRLSEFYGRAVIGPAMAITLLAGLATAGTVGFPFSSLWIVWGLVGFVVSVIVGGVAVARTGAALGAVTQNAGVGDPRVGALRQRMVVLNVVNLLVLASVVWAMSFKPTL